MDELTRGAMAVDDKKSRMTGWYDPLPVMRTGARALTSAIFGGLIDRRDLMAALDPFDEADFRHTH